MEKFEWDRQEKDFENGLFWNYDYRHYLRDIPEQVRSIILKRFIQEGLKPDDKSDRHFNIIINTLNKFYICNGV